MVKPGALLASVGTAVPETLMTNKDFEAFLDTSDEWIVTRTGIKQRHMFPRDKPGNAYILGAQASRKALDRAGLDAADVDAIICSTISPEEAFPSTACRIQQELGCSKAFAFDISAACSGFVYGISLANSLISTGQVETVLLVATEVISKVLDFTDRSTCILFGDGAGAAVLRKNTGVDAGVLSTSLMSNGVLGDIAALSAWGEQRFIKMDGNEVFVVAINFMQQVIEKAIEKAGLSLKDINRLILHQANIRIMRSVASNMNLPFEMFENNIDRFGNTSSASIPIALDEAWEAGRIPEGSLVVFAAVGGGLTAGGAVIKMGKGARDGNKAEVSANKSASLSRHGGQTSDERGRDLEPAVLTKDTMRDWMKAFLANEMGVGMKSVNTEKPLIQIGVDSLSAISLASKLKQNWGIVLNIGANYDKLSINQLVEETIQKHSGLKRPVEKQGPVAKGWVEGEI